MTARRTSGTVSEHAVRQVVMDAVHAGLYIHIPFCLTRCGYCDFNTYAGLGHLAGSYVEGVTLEAALAGPGWEGERFDSVFFGGGTPTILPPGQMVRLLDECARVFDLLPDAEITSEANPDTVDEPFLAALLDAGVTRLSMGVQSFDTAVLEALERAHSPESARAAFTAARRAGYGNVNLDLIYGAHGETVESWQRTVEEAARLEPEHLSCYALTIEPATPLGRKVAAGLLPVPDPDLQAEMYDLACRTLRDAGYEHYEISNWSRPGKRCRHNLGYWEGRPYLGLGAGAHSYRDGHRWWNVRPPLQYLENVSAGRLPRGGEEWLSPEDRRLEQLLLALRTTSGVPLADVEPSRADEVVQAGLAERDGARLRPTEPGLLMANEVVLSLLG
jgi:putative oxygen-independent coproporphyrinogen III oxidase